MFPSIKVEAMSAAINDGLRLPSVGKRFDGTALQAGNVINNSPETHTNFTKNLLFIVSSFNCFFNAVELRCAMPGPDSC
jgi:hypothetical protein